MLCSTCQPKTPHIFIGHCVKCPKTTTSFSFQLCDDCSKQLQECSWCRGPLSGASSPVVTTPSGVRFTVCRDNDNGTTVKGMLIGEQVHVTLTEDQWNGRQWAVKGTSWRFQQNGSPAFIQDPTNPQYGTRTFVFDLQSSGNGDIEIHEVTRNWGWWGGGTSGGTPITNGKQWKVTVQVK